MFKRVPPLPSYRVIQKGKICLLLNSRYADLLIRRGIGEFEPFLERYGTVSTDLKGRNPLISVLLEDGTRMLVRHYAHGGLFRPLTRDLFLSGSRGFQEVAVTEAVRTAGIPTIQPIGAVHRSIFPFLYRASFLSLEIPGAEDLTRAFFRVGRPSSRERLTEKRRIIRMSGTLIRQFHQAGFYHRDLQLKNILLADGLPLLIDFDRSYRKRTLSLEDRIENLLRLNRSVEKWIRRGLPVTRSDRWRFFLAYSEGDPEMKQALKTPLRTVPLRLIVHRCLWSFEKIKRGEGKKTDWKSEMKG